MLFREIQVLVRYLRFLKFDEKIKYFSKNSESQEILCFDYSSFFREIQAKIRSSQSFCLLAVNEDVENVERQH